MVARWQSEFAHAGAVSLWARQADSTALLGWAQSVGQFVVRHVFIILFTILTLFFLYQEGESLAGKFKRLLRYHIGERAEAYVDLATGALRASVNSMLVVALFDGFATVAHTRSPASPMPPFGPQSPARSHWFRSLGMSPSPLELATGDSRRDGCGGRLVRLRPPRVVRGRQDHTPADRAQRYPFALRLGLDVLPRRLRSAWTHRARYRSGRAESRQGAVGSSAFAIFRQMTSQVVTSTMPRMGLGKRWLQEAVDAEIRSEHRAPRGSPALTNTERSCTGGMP